MAERWGNSIQGGSARAQRFAIQMPLRYRAMGEIVWHAGSTENISRSGVLFQAEELMEVNTPLDMSFALPAEIGGEGGAQVLCRGRVVRTVLPLTTDALPALAARILDYRFVRGPDVPDA